MRQLCYINRDVYGQGDTIEEVLADAFKNFKALLESDGVAVVSINTDEDEGEWECADCGGAVDESDAICPHCGSSFEDEGEGDTEPEHCDLCKEPSGGGDGYDGLCSSCADKVEAKVQSGEFGNWSTAREACERAVAWAKWRQS